MRGFVDEGRKVLRVKGADARPLLQDLVTNDLDRLTPETLVYAALLTPQGKYLFDFLVGLEPDGALLLDVAAAQAAPLAQRLSMYRLRKDMEIEETETTVTLVWSEGGPPEGAPGAAVLMDPRDPALGWRVYGAAPGGLAGVEPGTRAEYDALRVALAVPETGVELAPNETFILESGFERLHGVDFRKGCYVGQEVTARMKHKTELKKGLVRVRVDGDAAPGTPVTAAGKPAGTLFTVAGSEGLAHLRFDRAEGEMEAGEARLHRL